MINERPLTEKALAEIEARANAATPGPWRWRANTTGKAVWLEGFRTNIVLDFIRWGTNGTQPRVNISGIMREMIPLMKTPAPHNDWDKWDVEHSDPTFIAHARTDVPTLVRDLQTTRAALRGLIGWNPKMGFSWENADNPCCSYCDAPLDTPVTPHSKAEHMATCPVAMGLAALPPED